MPQPNLTQQFNLTEIPDPFVSLFGYFTVISIATFFLSLLVIPLIIGYLPSDYFLKLKQREHSRQNLTINSLLILVLRNILGTILLFAGIAMLFLPGQGLLTILLAILVMTIPGKKHLVLRLVSQPTIQKSLNWVRSKNKKTPFTWPE